MTPTVAMALRSAVPWVVWQIQPSPTTTASGESLSSTANKVSGSIRRSPFCFLSISKIIEIATQVFVLRFKQVPESAIVALRHPLYATLAQGVFRDVGVLDLAFHLGLKERGCPGAIVQIGGKVIDQFIDGIEVGITDLVQGRLGEGAARGGDISVVLGIIRPEGHCFFSPNL
jgi:hypothetical protein